MTVTIFHNPRCSTSRGVLETIRAAGIEPVVIDYQRTPPSRDRLRQLLDDAGLRPRDAIRRKEPLYAELGLDDPALSDADLLAAMVEHPLLIERPLVETPRGVRLCRPPGRVREVLPPG